MTELLHPAGVYLVGAALVGIAPGRLRVPLLLLIPAGAVTQPTTIVFMSTSSWRVMGQIVACHDLPRIRERATSRAGFY